MQYNVKKKQKGNHSFILTNKKPTTKTGQMALVGVVMMMGPL